MNKKEQINRRIDETLASVDVLNCAEARPFLLTRIHARMNQENESVWEKAGWFIGRPAIAFLGLTMVILINLAVIMFDQPYNSGTATEQGLQPPADEFSYSVATIYDTENTQP
jgi:hypothetical protein